ncbi:MAG: type I DNA topoisomerase, partial [Firmicutes bacterium]|nr:type I DNA topoisomerase [Bacillota bacterium]
MKLVIIEGEGKRETVAKYLKKIDKDFAVFATKGHVRDLPTKTIAVDTANNFEPNYVIMDEKKAVVEALKKQAKNADDIYLATDPDREGEAISWHIAHILDIPADKKCRIIFNEISEKAVAESLERPRVIDQNTVDAQQARRVLDRLVGYKLSPVLCKKIADRLSAGRVQSVTLKLVVEREREIRAFVPQEYWTLTAHLEKKGARQIIKSALVSYKGKKIKVTSKEGMDAVLSRLLGARYIVSELKKSVAKSHAPAPYITSSLKQDALSRLGMTLKATDSAAQELYEGVNLGEEGKTALITYIRTDSTRVSSDAADEARRYIVRKFGAAYAPEKPNIYASKKTAQDAHEAIRPIHIGRTPESVKGVIAPNLYRLYKLIYERFLA